MKRISILIGFCLLCMVGANAQKAEYMAAIAKYKTVRTVTAKVVKTRHKAAVAKDGQSTGSFTIQTPDRMNISTAEGKEQLDMQAGSFTMVAGGKKHKTSSKANPLFATFQQVLENIMSGGQNGMDISQIPGVAMREDGGTVVLDVVPQAGSASARKKRQMFSSFVITIDTKTSEIKSLRMNERGQSYTLYEFSDFTFK